uniref:Uncharacterized protein n=1 Tax=viral metagenome TaxID=1070528 RepID=A0A6C0AH55_9ZZZZ
MVKKGQNGKKRYNQIMGNKGQMVKNDIIRLWETKGKWW